jgi:hypothetical protein
MVINEAIRHQRLAQRIGRLRIAGHGQLGATLPVDIQGKFDDI